MPSKYDEAQELSQFVASLVRQRALRALRRHDEQLSQVFERIAEGVRRDLRASGYTIKQVREILEKHFGATFAERLGIVEEAIRDAAREGRTLDQETFDAVYGGDAQATGPLGRSSAPRRKPSHLPARVFGDESPSTA